MAGMRFIIKKFAGAVVAITDTFTGTDGTDINGRATEGGGKTWAKLGTNTTVGGINTNRAKALSGSGYSPYVVDVGQANYTAEAVVGVAPAGAASATFQLVFRVQDATNYWAVNFRETGTNMVYTLARRDANTARVASIITTVTPTAGDRVKVIVTGPTAELVINDVSQGTADMTGWFETATQVGLGFHGSDLNTAIDEVTITPAAA